MKKIIIMHAGFNCEFQDCTAMEHIDFVCSICSLVLREPCMAGCCGARFCQNCIQKHQDISINTCPYCKSEDFYFVPDKNLKQKLLKSKVYCKNKNIGCDWIGELSRLDEHLNLNPPDGKYFEGCQFVEISCPSPSCPEPKQELLRGDMFIHYNKVHSSNRSVTSAELSKVIKGCEENFETRYEDLERKMRDVEERIEKSLEEKCQLELKKQQSDREQWQTEFEQQLKDEHLNELDRYKDEILKLLKQLKQKEEKIEHKLRVQVYENEKMQTSLERCMNEKMEELRKEQMEKFEELASSHLSKWKLDFEKHNERVEDDLFEKFKENESERRQMDLEKHTIELEEMIRRQQLEYSTKIDKKMKGCLMDLEQQMSEWVRDQEQMQAELKKYTKEIEQMQKLLMEQEQMIRECEGKQTDLKVHTGKIEDDLRSLKKENEGQQTESAKNNEELQRSLDELEKRMSECERKQTDLKVLTERSLKERSETDLATDEKMQKSLDELKNLEKRMVDCEGKQTNLQVHTGKVEDDMRSLKKENEGLQIELARNNELQRSLDELKKRMSECEEKQTDLKVHTDNIKDGMKSLKEKNKQWQTDLANFSKEAKEMEVKFEKTSEDLELQSERHRCEFEKELKEGTFKELKEEMVSMLKQLRDNECKIRSHEREASETLKDQLLKKIDEEISEMRKASKICKDQLLKKFDEEISEMKRLQLAEHKRDLENLVKKFESIEISVSEWDERMKQQVSKEILDKMESKKREVHLQGDDSDESENLMQRLEQYSQVLQKQLDEHQCQLKKKSLEFDILKKLMDTLREQIGKAEGWIDKCIGHPIGPVVLEMLDYQQYQKHGSDWFSSAFYTHLCGYKMCLNVFAKGYGKGEDSHISVYLHLMRGEFDAMLKWPFHGKIIIKLLKRGDIAHYTKKIVFGQSDEYIAATQQVVEKERNKIGCGLERFISHDDIQKYEKDGSLQFEITKVIID